jgi:plasmid stabilization system protein ParE
VRIAWSLRARRELAAHRRFIAAAQPAAAARVAARIVAATDRLTSYPDYGRAAPWDAQQRIRELPVAGTPFVVLYAVDRAAAEIVIVRVVHGAQLRTSD